MAFVYLSMDQFYMHVIELLCFIVSSFQILYKVFSEFISTITTNKVSNEIVKP